MKKIVFTRFTIIFSALKRFAAYEDHGRTYTMEESDSSGIPVWGYIVFILGGVIGLMLCSCHRDKNGIIERKDPLAQYRDTLVGKFNGIDIDTLIAEPIDTLSISEFDGDPFGNKHFKWRIFTKNNTVKDLILDGSTTGVHFIKEGDLDGNNTEEWGMLSDWPTSNWRCYYVYTYNDGAWEYLFEPMGIWLYHLEPDEGIIQSEEYIVQPSNIKGFVQVKFSDIRNDGADFLVIDTLITVNSQTINAKKRSNQ